MSLLLAHNGAFGIVPEHTIHHSSHEEQEGNKLEPKESIPQTTVETFVLTTNMTNPGKMNSIRIHFKQSHNPTQTGSKAIIACHNVIHIIIYKLKEIGA